MAGQLLIAGYNIVVQLGWAGVIGVCVILMAGPATTRFTAAFRGTANEVKAATSKRVGLTGEALHGIKALKVYGWVEWFSRRIAAAREVELAATTAKRHARAWISFAGVVSPLVVSLAAFGSYVLLYVCALCCGCGCCAVAVAVAVTVVVAVVVVVWLWRVAHSVTTTNGSNSEPLTAATAFTAVLWFKTLKVPSTMLPMAFARMADARVSLQRVQALLVAGEVATRQRAGPGLAAQGSSLPRSGECAISMVNATFTWDGEPSDGTDAPRSPSPVNTDEEDAPLLVTQAGGSSGSGLGGRDDSGGFVLRDMSISVAQGQLVVVMGPVGAGKSSLLAACASGEMNHISGSSQVVGNVAYVGQRPWILNTTIRCVQARACVYAGMLAYKR